MVSLVGLLGYWYHRDMSREQNLAQGSYAGLYGRIFLWEQYKNSLGTVKESTKGRTIRLQGGEQEVFVKKKTWPTQR